MNVTHVAHFGSSQRNCIRAKIEIAGLWQKLVIKSTALTHHYYHHHHHRHSENSANPNPNTGIIIHYVRAKKGFYWAAKIAKIMNSTADVPLNYWWWSMDLFDFVGTFKPLRRCGWNFQFFHSHIIYLFHLLESRAVNWINSQCFYLLRCHNKLIFVQHTVFIIHFYCSHGTEWMQWMVRITFWYFPFDF